MLDGGFLGNVDGSGAQIPDADERCWQLCQYEFTQVVVLQP